MRAETTPSPPRPHPVRTGLQPRPALEGDDGTGTTPSPILNRSALRASIAEAVQLLCDGETIAQRVQGSTRLVKIPPLLDQLDGTLIPATGGQSEGGSGGGAWESQLPCGIDALDVIVTITVAARTWLAKIGLRTNGTLRADLRELAQAADYEVPDQDLPALAHDAHQWVTRARVTTRWDARPWRPHVACPECGTLDKLAVKLGTSSAYCAACHMTWDAATIGHLAAQVKTATHTNTVGKPRGRGDVNHTTNVPKTLDDGTDNP